MRIRHTFLLCLALLWSTSVQAEALLNRLGGHPSPYLALHGEDPVAWQPWSPDALARARAEGKPVFLSIGYFSCHWCHVMQRESFKNPAIAALINAHFIPVKVDREIDTALDAQMIAFARKLTGTAGWPLNVFLTPEGDPFFAVIYQPPEAFSETLRRVDKAWQVDRADITRAARQAAVSTPVVGKPRPLSRERTSAARTQLIAAALALGDPLRGGLGGPSKFPQAPRLLALLRLLEQQDHVELRAFLLLTLEEMQNGGLRDHLRGGFFRYATDPDWRMPHFEKMLYDQTQLARVYLLAGRLLGRPDFTATAIETLDFMLTNLFDDKAGAFITALSAADEKYREGGDYLWRVEDLPPLEAGERSLLERSWGLGGTPDFDGGHLPMMRQPLPEAERAQLATLHRRLGSLRPITPPRDDKLLTGQNGLVLTALVEAANLDSRYRLAADRVARFLVGRMKARGGVDKGMRAGLALGAGELEDHAHAALGLLSHARLAGTSVEPVRRLLRHAWLRFHGKSGFRLGEASRENQAAMPDEAMPSASTALIEASLASGDKTLAALALKALAATPVPDIGRIIDHAGAVVLMENHPR